MQLVSQVRPRTQLRVFVIAVPTLVCFAESVSVQSPVHTEVEADEVDARSILAGGNLCGWTPDVAVVIWRRLLGALGDVNAIGDASVHALVFEHLCDLVVSVVSMRDNLSVSLDNQSSPPPPDLIPPIWLLVPWTFEASTSHVHPLPHLKGCIDAS